jgi:hypothetical protein
MLLAGVLMAGVWLGAPLRAQTDVGRFRVPDVDENGVMKSLLTGESARMFPDQPMQIIQLEILFYQEDGETVKVRITSPGCDYDPRARSAQSKETVRIVGDTFEITGADYVFEAGKNRMQINRDAKVRIRQVAPRPPIPPASANPELP